MTATTLRQILSLRSSFIQFGGDFFDCSSSRKSAETDLFCLTEQGLIIAECKDLFSKKDDDLFPEPEKITRIQESLLKNINIAHKINACAVILGISTNSLEMKYIEKFKQIVINQVEQARAQNIGLHLIVNNKIYLWGEGDGIEARQVEDINDLFVQDNIILDESSVGESPNNYGGILGANGLYDTEVFKQWMADLKG